MTTIRRPYSLPNCTLILEGLGDPTATSGQSEVRPLMSTLIHAECHFLGREQPLTGGREFFEGLVMAVNAYAQELLSGIHHPHDPRTRSAIVHFQKVGDNLHRLTLQTPPGDATQPNGVMAGTATAVAPVDLTTVQLFDLVEAIDQFFADTQTLPNLTVPITPIPKRLIRTREPVVQRSVPAVLGVSSVALAAAAFFFMPIPEVQRRPEETRPQPGSLTPGTEPTTAPPVPGASPNPETAPNSGIVPNPGTAPNSETPANSEGDPNLQEAPESGPSSSRMPMPTAAAKANAAETPRALASPESPASADLEVALATTTEITNATQLERLSQQLYTTLDRSWQSKPEFEQNLVYRVGVNPEGQIVGYKPLDEGALSHTKATPLFNLLKVPTPNARPDKREPIAQFRVVFTPKGALEVSPWHGYLASTSPGAGVLEVNSPERVEQLTTQIYQQIDQKWQGQPPFEQDLIYRVQVLPSGAIATYEPLNQSARDYVQSIPLPQLVASSSANLPDSRANFKVVFKPNGVLQVSPWEGYR